MYSCTELLERSWQGSGFLKPKTLGFEVSVLMCRWYRSSVRVVGSWLSTVPWVQRVQTAQQRAVFVSGVFEFLE